MIVSDNKWYKTLLNFSPILSTAGSDRYSEIFMVLSVSPSSNTSLLLREMLRTSLMGIQQFLTADRVIVAKIMPKGEITVIEEVRNPSYKTMLNVRLSQFWGWL